MTGRSRCCTAPATASRPFSVLAAGAWSPLQESWSPERHPPRGAERGAHAFHPQQQARGSRTRRQSRGGGCRAPRAPAAVSRCAAQLHALLAPALRPHAARRTRPSCSAASLLLVATSNKDADSLSLSSSDDHETRTQTSACPSVLVCVYYCIHAVLQKLLQQASTTREAERYKIHPAKPGPPERKRKKGRGLETRARRTPKCERGDGSAR